MPKASDKEYKPRCVNYIKKDGSITTHIRIPKYCEWCNKWVCYAYYVRHCKTVEHENALFKYQATILIKQDSSSIAKSDNQ